MVTVFPMFWKEIKLRRSKKQDGRCVASPLANNSNLKLNLLPDLEFLTETHNKK